MLLIGFENLGQLELQEKYSNNFNYIQDKSYNRVDKNWIIKYLEDIKTSLNKYDVTFINYNIQIINCLQAINLQFKLIYTGKQLNNNLTELFDNAVTDKYVLKDNSLEWYLSKHFDWVKLEQNNSNEIVENTKIEQNTKQEDNKNNIEVQKESVSVKEDNKELKENSIAVEVKEVAVQPQKDKNKLTLEELVDDDLVITEEDVRELKATQNKLKVGLLLQAKNSLKRVLKLSNVLDKLYDELLDRVDNSLTTTDTASLMYTTEYISKALNDTNQFIVSLINNDKIQNFFIVDNSSVVNIGSVDSIDIDSRERLRKATEIVMDNIDYFVDGEFKNIKDPNKQNEEQQEVLQEEQKEDKQNAGTES